MVRVESSNVRAVDWDRDSQIMTVVFKDGGRYEYDGIKGDLAAQIVFASSVGKVLHAYRLEGRKVAS